MTGKQSTHRAALHRDQVWPVIDGQRRRLAGLLDELSEEEWRVPSLCPGWTVRDVAAHLTLQQLGLRDVIAMMAQWRGSMDRTIQYAACRRAAALPTERIIAEIRGMVGSRRHTIGVTYLETLTDILVHGQDIAVPSAAATTCRRRPRPPPPAGCCRCAGPRRFPRRARWAGSS